MRELGVTGYPLLVIAILIVWSALRVGLDLRRERSVPPTRAGVNAILYWGVLAALVGVLGTMVGFSQVAGFIAGASQISPSLVWGGVKVALSTAIAGFTLLTLAGLIWLPLQAIRERREQPHAGSTLR